ncbi:DNA replication factor Cdt1 isoform X2 [Condylostylus longicornis]|uniref:DNA replication factor Cdt1 isoform X2 n=1 Tax=Condylostylus longicornis TaxID=2530218 RepID=UPI00244DC7B6|nr:DNA replication factor Cdt1 isoform X2 [Condylostylus longicornis]
MSQPSVASYFNSRKRPAADEIITHKNKVFLSEVNDVPKCNLISPRVVDVDAKKQNITFSKHNEKEICITQTKSVDQDNLIAKHSDLYGSSEVKILDPPFKFEEKLQKKILKNGNGSKVSQQNLVKFIKKGLLSPKQLTPKKDETNVFGNTNKNVSLRDNQREKLKTMVRKELTFDEVKAKVTRSAKLQELKASINRIQELEKTRKIQEEKNKLLKNGTQKETHENGVSLKEFKTIDLEVLTSPVKGFRTPVKCPPPAPDKNELMSPKSTTPKRLLFSPSKDGSSSDIVQTPAYHKFLHLSKTPSLSLPFKYRNLIEIFKAVDSVCAMYFNRKECITFKKLKTAVQRMIRRNFHENHLAQIKYVYPEAYYFYQTKMRNYGSISKQDYFQLVITPNIGVIKNVNASIIDEDNVLKSAQSNAMNPQILTERYQKLQYILLEKVKNEHDKFLKSLNPPLNIPKDQIKRWHPEFDLENCPEIEEGHLPQPPNVEKYSSAKDILLTARNLFNQKEEIVNCATKNLINPDNSSKEPPAHAPQLDNVESTLLKSVPKSLLEKIRAKQAAKAHSSMTRRPSQDQEVRKYSRLPELARHLRNVFVTEKKGVLPLEALIKKIENSYRTSLTPKDIEVHLKLIAKECPTWVQFHDIRKTIYVKMNRDFDLTKIVENLEKIANEKSK